MGVIRVKRSGSWAPARGLYVKQSGAWTPAEKAFIKKNGAWEQIYPTPSGVLSVTPSTVTLEAYEDFSSTPVTVTFKNTGTDNIIVNNIAIAQNVNFTTYFDGATNFTLAPDQERTMVVRMSANKRGTAERTTVDITGTATIVVYQNIGAFGDIRTDIPVNGTVKPDYAEVTLNPTSVSYTTNYDLGPARSAINITNSGNGGKLNITNIYSVSGTVIEGDALGILNKGQSTRIGLTSPTGEPAGTHADTIFIETDIGTYSVPVTLTVISTGVKEYIVPGTYTWTVPLGVSSATVEMVAGGGGGGGSTEVGNGGAGGGGGSGGYKNFTIALTAGETITISVGAGGAGAPFVGRNPGAIGAEGPGLSGGSSYITSLAGTHTVTGGGGGTSGTGGSGGGGGLGGTGDGNVGFGGQAGTNDYSSTNGGAGAASPLSPGGSAGAPGNPGYKGSGGGGASAPDRVNPYNWAGGKGGDGYVKISW